MNLLNIFKSYKLIISELTINTKALKGHLVSLY